MACGTVLDGFSEGFAEDGKLGFPGSKGRAFCTEGAVRAGAAPGAVREMSMTGWNRWGEGGQGG